MIEPINYSRRKWLALGGVVLGASLLPNSVIAMIPTPKPRILSFHNINTGERLSLAFSLEKGIISPEAKKIDYFMRDKRNGEVHQMDPRLFAKFYRMQQALGLRNAEINVICGYRSPASNSAMRRRSRGVASNSYHLRGQAVDFRIDGVPLVKVRNAVQGLRDGGTGFYPRSNFIHMDTGPVRTWKGA